MPELIRLRKILAKDRGAMEEPLRLSTGRLTKTPGDALGRLLENHFPDARINKEPVMSLNTTKTGANSIDRHMGREVVTEDKVRWIANTSISDKVPGLDGIYSIYLQKGLHLIIKYLIKVYRGSIAMGHRDVRVVLIK